MSWSMTLNHVPTNRIASYTYIFGDAKSINFSQAGLLIKQIKTPTLDAKVLANVIHKAQS
jgi:hypothetical protein